MRCPKSDRIFTADIKKELRPRLLERLNQFTEYTRTGQYEKLYDFYLPGFLADAYDATDEHKFADIARVLFATALVDFKLDGVTMLHNGRYGPTYDIFGVAKVEQNGKALKVEMRTDAVIRNGEWYFVDEFRRIPH